MLKDKINKASTIIKAMINPLPEGEDWYENRIDICNLCEYNTKNMDKEALSAKDKLKLTIHLCPEGDHCTACGCCTHRKSSQKSETCGLEEIGKVPKWVALEIKSPIDENISVENLTPDVGKLVMTPTEIHYNIGDTTRERLDVVIVLKRKGGLDVQSTEVGCKCTVAETEVLDKNSAKFNVIISTKDFVKNKKITRTFTIHHYATSKKVEEINIVLKLIRR